MADGAAYHLRRAANTYKPGDELRAARQALGWTQHDMAERLDVRQATVSDWENGRQTPGDQTREKWKALADELESDAPGGEE